MEKKAKRFRADPCAQCGGATVYVGRYDRFACERCNRWTDEPCKCESDCPFPPAPERPFESKPS